MSRRWKADAHPAVTGQRITSPGVPRVERSIPLVVVRPVLPCRALLPAPSLARGRTLAGRNALSTPVAARMSSVHQVVRRIAYDLAVDRVHTAGAVSYTHLTLPTIYSV